MSKPDIVTRLRKFAREFSFTDTHSDFSLTEAADEIERLREQLRLANIDNFNTTAEANKLRAERDDARQDFCYCDDGWPLSDEQARKRADELGWDCFKEDKP